MLLYNVAGSLGMEGWVEERLRRRHHINPCSLSAYAVRLLGGVGTDEERRLNQIKV